MKRSDTHLGTTHDHFEEKVYTVGILLQGMDELDFAESLDELKRLVETLGGQVLETTTQKREKPSASSYIGKGKAEEIGKHAKELGCTLIAFDTELSGTQIKTLEEITQNRVIDRTGVILDIFHRHARSKESKNQVELASLEYLITRLTRRWTHLERQKGGIGLKGVGERQIELDRRMIRSRISRLKQEIKHAAEERATQRRHRDHFLRVALVGYTNAGKSTLMNNLTLSEVLVEDRLFATLDSTVRVIDPKTRPPILLSDTVGFIDKLPHALVASFRSTLQEVLEADLLLHVVDLSSPRYMEQLEVTRKVLEEIGAGDRPAMLVFNKADLVQEVFLPRILERSYINSVVVSALRPPDMKRLRQALYDYFERDMIEMEVVVPYDNTFLHSRIHEFSKVLETDYVEEGARFKIRIMKSTANWLKLASHVVPS